MLTLRTKIIALRALVQAKNNPNSRILFVCGKAANSASVWKHLIRNKIEGFSYDVFSRQIMHKGGGIILIRHTEHSVVSQFSGLQISHLWVDEDVRTADTLYLKTRIRSTREQNDPMGVYDFHGMYAV